MILFLLVLKLLFPSPIILLFSVPYWFFTTSFVMQKNWLFVNSKVLILLRSQLILPLLCFVQAYMGQHWCSPTALTRLLLTYWISLPHLKQGLWLIVQRSNGLMMTLNNSSVSVVASKREPWKLTSLVTGIITIKFIISSLHFLNLHVWIIIQT